MGTDNTKTSDDESTPSYCISCGSELPDKASFCPDCGAEVDTDSDSMKNETKPDHAHPDPEKAASKAEGDIPSEFLSDTKVPDMLSLPRSGGDVMLFDDPLISYIEPDEQPQHLLKHPSAGLRIIEPNGDERTPHHGNDGYRFLLATDRRVFYIAAYEGEDITREFAYENIEQVQLQGQVFGGPKIEIQTDDGTVYLFCHSQTNPVKPRSMNTTEYIKNKIE